MDQDREKMEEREPEIRKAAAAGMFYPGHTVELVKTIATMFSEVDKAVLPARPLALISPHAGYPYSGLIAAKGYKLLEGEEYDNVVVVAPSHAVFFKGCSVFEGSGYETPIGVVEINRKLSDKIAGINPLVHYSSQGHATGKSRGEHALEVQLPFLQVVLGKFKLIAIVMGDQEEESVTALGETLAAALRGTNSLIVASTDLSHYHDEKKARRLDFAVQTAIEKFDPELLMNTLAGGKGEACGGGPVAATMLATKRLGSKEIRFLDYTTSGATTGDFDEVVGYLSAAIIAPRQMATARAADPTIGTRAAESTEARELTDKQKQQLLDIARKAIAARLDDKEYSAPEIKGLGETRSLFVTLKLDGKLRGCIGQVKARLPLPQAVAEMAQAAAFEDPRFELLSRDEYERLEYEISILSPLQWVRDFEKIEIGRHGLMIKLDMHSGLYLPQVASEHDWSVTEFLEETCLKAGLATGSYKRRQVEIYMFTTEVFQTA